MKDHRCKLSKISKVPVRTKRRNQLRKQIRRIFKKLAHHHHRRRMLKKMRLDGWGDGSIKTAFDRITPTDDTNIIKGSINVNGGFNDKAGDLLKLNQGYLTQTQVDNFTDKAAILKKNIEDSSGRVNEILSFFSGKKTFSSDKAKKLTDKIDQQVKAVKTKFDSENIKKKVQTTESNIKGKEQNVITRAKNQQTGSQKETDETILKIGNFPPWHNCSSDKMCDNNKCYNGICVQ